MAIKRVSTTDDGVNLELTRAEFEQIGRALYTAFERARLIGASADETGIGRLIADLIAPADRESEAMMAEVERLTAALRLARVGIEATYEVKRRAGLPEAPEWDILLGKINAALAPADRECERLQVRRVSVPIGFDPDDYPLE